MSGRKGPELQIALLGGFRVAVDGTAVDEAAWRLRSARSVIKLLALAPQHSLHREHAIEALWPGRDPSSSSNNLPQALFVARRALDACGDDGGGRIALAHDVLTLTTEPLGIDIEEVEAAAPETGLPASLRRHTAAHR